MARCAATTRCGRRRYSPGTTRRRGGHPGEDYNCRCWAEAYYPASAESRQRAIKLRVRASALRTGKLSIPETPPSPLVQEVMIIGDDGNPFDLQGDIRGGGGGGRRGGGGKGRKKQSSKWKFGKHKSDKKWKNQMEKRGWTKKQITETIKNGNQHSAPNKVNPNNKATRYEYKGKFVVRDEVTKEILQISGSNFIPNK